MSLKPSELHLQVPFPQPDGHPIHYAPGDDHIYDVGDGEAITAIITITITSIKTTIKSIITATIISIKTTIKSIITATITSIITTFKGVSHLVYYKK